MGSGAAALKPINTSRPHAGTASGGDSASSSQSAVVKAASANARVTLDNRDGLESGLTIITNPENAVRRQRQEQEQGRTDQPSSSSTSQPLGAGTATCPSASKPNEKPFFSLFFSKDKPLSDGDKTKKTQDSLIVLCSVWNFISEGGTEFQLPEIKGNLIALFKNDDESKLKSSLGFFKRMKLHFVVNRFENKPLDIRQTILFFCDQTIQVVSRVEAPKKSSISVLPVNRLLPYLMGLSDLKGCKTGLVDESNETPLNEYLTSKMQLAEQNPAQHFPTLNKVLLLLAIHKIHHLPAYIRSLQAQPHLSR